MRKRNKLYTVNKYNKNFFDDGGVVNKIAAVGQGVGEIVESARQNAQIDDAAVANKENEISNTELNATKQYSDLDALESAMTSWDKIDNVNWRDIRGSNVGQQLLSVFNASNAGAQSGSSFGGVGAIVGGIAGAVGSGIGSIIGRIRAQNKAEELNIAANRANTIQQNNFNNQSSVIQQQRAANLESAYIGADGGLLNLNSDGGSIYIKPSKRGSFTREAKERGLGVQEFASKVLANKDNYSTAMVKKANFAKNASKWHNDGGPLFTNGATWSNGITTINNGDTHENNPNDGVQIGVDNEGVPNLVEEGEVIWNDYVFSNRLTLSKQNREKLKLGKKDLTYADAAKKLQKESEERPNDPISKRGLEDSLRQLTEMQEIVRTKKNNNNNRFDWGGDTYLRYAPALGNFANVLTDAFGITNKEDYSNADLIRQSVKNLSNVTYNPISNYLSYRPFDRNYYSNKLSNQAAATRRAIVENSGLNRAAATAGLLAADYNAQTKLGDLYRQAEEYNLAQRQKVEEFNRGTNMANSEMAMKAALANQKNDELRYKAGLAEAQMREDISRLASSNRSANRSAFLEDLGNIGKENFIFNMINSNPAFAASLSNSGNVQHRDRTSNNSTNSSINSSKDTTTVEDILNNPGSSGIVTSVSRKKGGKIRRKKGGKYGKLYSF